MQDNNKIAVFEAFAKKAAQRLEEKKKHRTERLLIKSMNMEIEIRGLSDTELNDCMEFSDSPVEVDRYTLFMASETLQETAKIMVRDGLLQQEYKITEMFTGSERNFLVRRVLELSGASGEADIEIIRESEEVKNS